MVDLDNEHINMMHVRSKALLRSTFGLGRYVPANPAVIGWPRTTRNRGSLDSETCTCLNSRPIAESPDHLPLDSSGFSAAPNSSLYVRHVRNEVVTGQVIDTLTVLHRFDKECDDNVIGAGHTMDFEIFRQIASTIDERLG